MSENNRLNLQGRIGVEPQLRTGRSGTPWMKLKVATNRHSQAGALLTDWHDVRVFGEDAVRAAEWARLGTEVRVEGQLVYDTYRPEGEEGPRVRMARVLARSVEPVQTTPRFRPMPAGMDGMAPIDLRPMT
jgi:single-stranded DNA-binding protein